ncbi:hypothetical protein SLA2020_413590 [Shorea laevis]
MEEIQVVLRKFGDEQSTLLDRFERLSFEVQLSQAMLRRSLSEPTVVGLQAPVVTAGPAPPSTVTKVRRRRHGSSAFHKVLKKLLKPILSRKGGGGGRREVPDPKNPCSWKAFSRSLRV